MIQEVVGDMITNLGTEEERASVRNTLKNTIEICVKMLPNKVIPFETWMISLQRHFDISKQQFDQMALEYIKNEERSKLEILYSAWCKTANAIRRPPGLRGVKVKVQDGSALSNYILGLKQKPVLVTAAVFNAMDIAPRMDLLKQVLEMSFQVRENVTVFYRIEDFVFQQETDSGCLINRMFSRLIQQTVLALIMEFNLERFVVETWRKTITKVVDRMIE